MNPRCQEQPPDLVIEGIELFNVREYFEAHEVLEAAWKDENEPIRDLYQGILLIGVGFYHLTCQNYHGAIVKLQSGADLLESFTPAYQGIEIAPLIASARKHREEIVARGPANIADFDPSTFPKIVYTFPQHHNHDPQVL